MLMLRELEAIMTDHKAKLLAAQLFERDHPGRHLVAKGQKRLPGSNSPPLGASPDEYASYMQRARQQLSS